MRILFSLMLLAMVSMSVTAQETTPEPVIEVTCNVDHAADYSRFLRQAADALDNTVAGGGDADIAIANTEGVISVILNLLASCDSLYFSSFAYRAEPGETAEIGPFRLRRGAYRIIAVGEPADVTFSLTGVGEDDTCGTDDPVTLTEEDIRLGMYAILVVDNPAGCEVVLSMSSESEDYGLFFNYIPRQPLVIDND